MSNENGVPHRLGERKNDCNSKGGACQTRAPSHHPWRGTESRTHEGWRGRGAASAALGMAMLCNGHGKSSLVDNNENVQASQCLRVLQYSGRVPNTRGCSRKRGVRSLGLPVSVSRHSTVVPWCHVRTEKERQANTSVETSAPRLRVEAPRTECWGGRV